MIYFFDLDINKEGEGGSMKLYRLWFGKFNGKTVEQVMFLRGGYRYLKEFILGKKFRNESVRARVRLIFAEGERLQVIRLCHECGKEATHMIVQGDDRVGYSFLPECCCEEHLLVGHSQRTVPIKFSSLGFFAARSDQWKFINHLRWCCGISQMKITPESALEFFFPPELVEF